MVRFLSFALLALPAAVIALPESWDRVEESSYTFELFEKDFGKTYSESERFRRQEIFERNLAAILEHNAKTSSSYVMGINHMMDLEPHELPLGYDKMAGRKSENTAIQRHLKKRGHEMDLPFDIDDVSTLPKSVDWRGHGVVTPVKDQGGCGSCWAFATTASLESHIAIRTGVLFTLSTQELVSCAPNPRHCGGNGGCTGSTGELAFDFVAGEGIVQEWQMGYGSYHGATVNCTIMDVLSAVGRPGGLRGPDPPGIKGSVATIEGYAVLPTNDYAALMNAVAKMGPLVVSVAAHNWSFYKRGVFEDHSGSPASFDINHAVVLVGYGTDEATGVDYWLIRNSWSPTWGEGGYIRLKRVDPATLDEPDSICGLDITPADGSSCTEDDDGNSVTPPPLKVCGTSGVMVDSSLPVGGRLVHSS